MGKQNLKSNSIFNKDKKGMIQIVAIMISIVVVGILAILLVNKVSGGSSIDSLVPQEPGCKPKDIGVRVAGTLDVTDTAFWGVQPEPVKISVSEVKEYSLLGILSQDYEWKVCLVNTRTNNEVDCDSGKDNHPGGDENVQHKNYVLDFKLPDNNCDSMIDDFDGQLVAYVYEDGEDHMISKYVSFRNGKWTAS